MDEAYDYLNNKLNKNLDVFAVNEGNGVFLEINGPSELIEHSKNYFHFRLYLPAQLKKYEEKLGRFKLSRKKIDRLGLYDRYCSQIIDDFALQDWYTKNFDYTYLTNSDVEIEVIKKINSEEYNKRNELIMKGLQHNLLTFSNSQLGEVLKYRKKNEGIFDDYRINIHRLIKELDPQSEKEVREAFLDTVKPEIERIDVDIKQYRKSLAKELGSNLLLNSGLVILGMHSGILPENISDIVSTLGGVGGLSTSIKHGTKILQKPAGIRDNPYFFLWKLNKKIK
jgi:hypothetical protein